MRHPGHGLYRVRVPAKLTRHPDAATLPDADIQDWLYNGGHRGQALGTFVEIMCALTDAQYWRFLASIYNGTERTTLNRAAWLRLFTAPSAGREHLMEPADLAAFDLLPDPVPLYRGAVNPRGLSWTTDLDTAIWFACVRGVLHRAPYTRKRSHHVFAAAVSKSAILAYFVDRGECEAVIDARNIPCRIVSFERAELDAALERRAATMGFSAAHNAHNAHNSAKEPNRREVMTDWGRWRASIVSD